MCLSASFSHSYSILSTRVWRWWRGRPRMEMIPAREAPVSSTGAVAWIRRNLFANVLDSIVSVVLGVTIVWAGWSLINWILFSASWGPLWENMRLLFVYRYPPDLLWRPLAVTGLILSLL